MRNYIFFEKLSDFSNANFIPKITTMSTFVNTLSDNGNKCNIETEYLSLTRSNVLLNCFSVTTVSHNDNKYIGVELQ